MEALSSLLIIVPAWLESNGDRWVPFTKDYHNAVKLPGIWDAMTLTWRHYNDIMKQCDTFLPNIDTNSSIFFHYHHYEVMMGAMASQITSLTIVHSTVY